MNVIECRNLSKVYGQKKALNQMSFTIKENTITGVIGRNGAGKTTLLKIIAGFIHQSDGEINVFSATPFNNLTVSSNRIFIDDQLNFPNSLTLQDILKSASTFYGNWDHQLSERLFQYFSFQPKQRYQQLSKGMKSTFNMIIGLSARCPLTIFDEPTTGMDSAVRKDFYRALLKDYLDYPRTIILSSHLLSEIEELLEDVLLIKNGAKCLHHSIDELKEYAIRLHGEEETVRNILNLKDAIYMKKIGLNQIEAVVENTLTEQELQQLRGSGILTSQVSADDICTYLTSKSIGGIDDVFNRD